VKYFELSKAIPDQVTTERLHEARGAVSRILELDPASIDATTLAERLQGMSRAVSDIVISKEVTRLAEPAAFYILRHFDDPQTRTGRMFVAQPYIGHATGASMAVHDVTPGNQRIVTRLHFPTDLQIDDLLMHDPASWNNMTGWAQDFRSGRPMQAYPFHNSLAGIGAPGRYLSLAQELSQELLAITQ
jgi:hypothetical protein